MTKASVTGQRRVTRRECDDDDDDNRRSMAAGHVVTNPENVGRTKFLFLSSATVARSSQLISSVCHNMSVVHLSLRSVAVFKVILSSSDDTREAKRSRPT